jgi:hypothetical protein
MYMATNARPAKAEINPNNILSAICVNNRAIDLVKSEKKKHGDTIAFTGFTIYMGSQPITV